MIKGNYKKIKKYFLSTVFMSILLFSSGCMPSQAGEEGLPVEPVTPQEPFYFAFFEQYITHVYYGEINDLLVTTGGESVLLATENNKIYLLDQKGRLIWEYSLVNEAWQVAASSGGDIFSVVSREGEVLFLSQDKKVLGELNLAREVLGFALSEDGTKAALITSLEAEVVLHLVDYRGQIIWERELFIDSEEKVTISVFTWHDSIIFAGQREGTNILVQYNLDGSFSWQRQGYAVAVFLPSGKVAAIKDTKLVLLNNYGQEIWSYDTNVNLTHVCVAQESEDILVYSAYNMGEDNLYHFSATGLLSWRKRVPTQAEIFISAVGHRVAIVSWRHYREEITSVLVYDAFGKEIANYQIAGRGQKAVFSGDGEVLVLTDQDGNVFLFDLRDLSGEEFFSFASKAPTYKPILFADDGHNYMRLFFYNDQADVLLPVSRRVSLDFSPAQAVKELIRGPRLGSGLLRTVPGETEIKTELQGNTIYIDLPVSLEDAVGGAIQAEAIIRSLLYTVSQFPQVEQVQFLIGGERKEYFGQGPAIFYSFSAREPGSAPGRQVLFEPITSGGRYYLVMREVALWSFDKRELAADLLAELFVTNREFFPINLIVNRVDFEGEIARIDLSADLRELYLFLSDHCRAELLLESITFTIAKNFTAERVELLINGRRYEHPDLPQLTRKISRPFFINPE